MNPLHLSGYGVKIRVSNLATRSELEVRNGRHGPEKPYETSFYRPRRFPYSSIIVEGHNGYISLQALHWLSRNNVAVFVTNFDGSIISSILPPMSIKADLRAAQLEASRDPKIASNVARALIEAKIARSIQVLEWLAERYDLSREVSLTRREAMNLPRARTVTAIRTVEGRVALRYWDAFGKVVPEHLDFQGRMTSSHQNNATDPVNAALNYGYGFLEGECRKAIHAVGLEPAVGFLHNLSDYQTKQSLVYDLEEPFRWLIDLTVIQGFESKTLDLDDFYFTGDDYRYRFEHEAKIRFIKMLREQFNSGVKYKGRALKWDTVIEEKASELARYLAGRTTSFELIEPAPVLERTDNRAIREIILRLTQKKARSLGIEKSTLHYLREKSRCDASFTSYSKVRRRLETELELERRSRT